MFKNVSLLALAAVATAVDIDAEWKQPAHYGHKTTTYGGHRASYRPGSLRTASTGYNKKSGAAGRSGYSIRSRSSSLSGLYGGKLTSGGVYGKSHGYGSDYKDIDSYSAGSFKKLSPKSGYGLGYGKSFGDLDSRSYSSASSYGRSSSYGGSSKLGGYGKSLGGYGRRLSGYGKRIGGHGRSLSGYGKRLGGLRGGLNIDEKITSRAQGPRRSGYGGRRLGGIDLGKRHGLGGYGGYGLGGGYGIGPGPIGPGPITPDLDAGYGIGPGPVGPGYGIGGGYGIGPGPIGPGPITSDLDAGYGGIGGGYGNLW